MKIERYVEFKISYIDVEDIKKANGDKRLQRSLSATTIMSCNLSDMECDNVYYSQPEKWFLELIGFEHINTSSVESFKKELQKIYDYDDPMIPFFAKLLNNKRIKEKICFTYDVKDGWPEFKHIGTYQSTIEITEF